MRVDCPWIYKIVYGLYFSFVYVCWLRDPPLNGYGSWFLEFMDWLKKKLMFLTLFCDVHGAARSPQYAWWLFDACCLVEITCSRDPLVVGCAWALTFGRGRRPPNAFWCFFPSWCSPCVFTFLLNGSLLFSENLCVAQ